MDGMLTFARSTRSLSTHTLTLALSPLLLALLLLLWPLAGDSQAAQYQAISAGLSHTCAIDGGAAKCWGENNYGQLGNGTKVNSTTPVAVSGLGTGVTAIAAGTYRTCAIQNGGAKCWGSLSPDQTTPIAISGLGEGSGLTQIVVGGTQACTILPDTTMVCWGYNSYGQLGNGTTSFTFSLAPVDVKANANPLDPAKLTGVTAMAAGNRHTCAIVTSGALKCWGSDEYGQLGDSASFDDKTTPTDVSGMGGSVTSISAGLKHTCAVRNGGAWCWGEGEDGQLGIGTLLGDSRKTDPRQVSGLSSGVASVAATSVAHSCALKTDNTAYCWGMGSKGQLGSGQAGSSLVPVAVDGPPQGFSALTTGGNHTCAIVAPDTPKCWGLDEFGQVGTGFGGKGKATAVQVAGLTSGVTAISLRRFGCAVKSGSVFCWGTNERGRLGDGTTNNSAVPVHVDDLPPGATAVTTGDRHACAIVAGGAWCWGSDSEGQLGNDLPEGDSGPVQVLGLSSGVTAITAGVNHTCAIKDGVVYCWGDAIYRQLGPDQALDSPKPVVVGQLQPGIASDITAGNDITCVLEAGAMKCWGRGSGYLNGEPGVMSGFDSSLTTIAVQSWPTVFCAIQVGAAKCSGYNHYGQLGDGTDEDRLTPVGVQGLESGVSAISVGDTHTCAIKTDGAWCWGNDGFTGVLGSGTILNYFQLTPVAVVGIASPTAIAAGDANSCAIQAGAAKCWGAAAGGLGDGNAWHSSPVDVLDPNGDATPPAVTINSPTTGSTSTSAAVRVDFTASDDRGAVKSTTCQIDDATPTACTSPWSTPALANGAHSLTISATDFADNVGSASASFIVNVAAPASPVAPTPVAPTDNRASAKIALKKSGKTKVKGKSVSFAAVLSLKPPKGVATRTACKSAKLTATTKPKGAKKAIKAKASLKSKGKNCQAIFKFKLPKKFKGKKVKIAVTFPGNTVFKQAKKTVSYKIR
jgi:alpha-tubulin suppressor-like RCC1 family protein